MADYQVNAGELRTKITLQSPTISQDVGGAQVASWANVTINPTVRSRWVNIHGQETASEALKSVQRAAVTVRYRSDAATTWRILKVDDGTYWQIISVDQVRGQRRWTELLVERAKGTV
jgi:head-tail adaptor